MSENKKKSGINKMVIALCILIILVGLTSFGLFSTLNKLKDSRLVTSDVQENFHKLKVVHDQKQDEIEKCRKEMDSLSKRLEGIKNADDLLKRDIFLYIDKKFQLIPRTVALDIAEQILILSKKENVSPELIVGIIQVESAFNPMAISKKNARGLMQVMPEWAKKFGLERVSDLHDIDTNIRCGIKVLKIHIEEGKGSISKGLYYYVGKSEAYAGKVYAAMGKFVAFRSTIDDDDCDIEINGNGDKPPEQEGNEESGIVNGAKKDSH